MLELSILYIKALYKRSPMTIPNQAPNSIRKNYRDHLPIQKIPNLLIFTVAYPIHAPTIAANTIRIHFVDSLDSGVINCPKNVN